jgi:hypothetical protein
MAGKLSIGAQQEIAFFDEVRKKLDHLHSLIEQLAAAKIAAQQNQFMGPITRTATEVQRVLMNGGHGVMADSANQIAMNAKRGGGMNLKIRVFRELVNSIKAAMETRIKVIIAEESRTE